MPIALEYAPMTISTLNDRTEQTIARQLVKAGLDEGLAISVHDGESYALKRSNSQAAIEAAMASTDEDRLYFWRGDNCVGWIWLIYGNGEDLISDYTDNQAMNALAERAQAR